MKQTVKLILFFVELAFMTSCKRDGDVTSQAIRPPVARAGPDVSVSLSLCTDKNGAAVLDGTASLGSNLSYHWQNISFNQAGAILKNQDSAVAIVEDIRAGEYVFELTVRETNGRFSSDTLLVSAKGPVKEYDFDISVLTPFTFTEDYVDYYRGYIDFTEIIGGAYFNPFGQFGVNIYETADTSDFFDDHDTYIQIFAGNYDRESLFGQCSVNFKRLIRQGGGLFDGVLKISGGSAQRCDGKVFDNLSPLSVTGNLNLPAGTVDFRISGKVYF